MFEAGSRINIITLYIVYIYTQNHNFVPFIYTYIPAYIHTYIHMPCTLDDLLEAIDTNHDGVLSKEAAECCVAGSSHKD